jgi:hypothetical protein
MLVLPLKPSWLPYLPDLDMMFPYSMERISRTNRRNVPNSVKQLWQMDWQAKYTEDLSNCLSCW